MDDSAALRRFSDDFENIEFLLNPRYVEWEKIKKRFHDSKDSKKKVEDLISAIQKFGPRCQYEFANVAELPVAMECFVALSADQHFVKLLKACLLDPSCHLLQTVLMYDRRAAIRYFLEVAPKSAILKHDEFGLPIHNIRSFEMLQLLVEYGADPEVQPHSNVRAKTEHRHYHNLRLHRA